jgi:hypothetical protein
MKTKSDQRLTKKEFFLAASKTELIFTFSGRQIKVFKLAYLPEGHKYLNLVIEETNKEMA